MNKILLLAAALLIASAGVLSAANPKCNIDFKGVDTQQVLAFYASLSGLKPVTDSRVKAIHQPVEFKGSNLSKAQATSGIEQALLKQTGIVITHLDGGRVSVTYNDALKLANPPR